MAGTDGRRGIKHSPAPLRFPGCAGRGRRPSRARFGLNVGRAGTLAGVLFVENDSLPLVELLERRLADTAAMEEPLLAAIVADEAEPLSRTSRLIVPLGIRSFLRSSPGIGRTRHGPANDTNPSSRPRSERPAGAGASYRVRCRTKVAHPATARQLESRGPHSHRRRRRVSRTAPVVRSTANVLPQRLGERAVLGHGDCGDAAGAADARHDRASAAAGPGPSDEVG